MATQPLIDFSRLEELRELDPELVVVRETLDLMLADGQQRVQAAQAALAAGDLKTLASQAHSLRGAAVNVGATAVFELASAIEARVKSGAAPADLKDSAEDLAACWDATCRAFEQWLADASAGSPPAP